MCSAVCTQARAPMNRGFPVRKVTNKVALTVILYYSLDPLDVQHSHPASRHVLGLTRTTFSPPFSFVRFSRVVCLEVFF